MRMLCGLSKPTEGDGRVAGFDIDKEVEQVKASIGYMSQKFSLYNDLKVWENIRLFAGIYGMRDREIAQKTDELLQRLNFASERNTLVKELPLGWKQKLAFSVSIFHHPKVVFLDEPTGGVDPVTRRQFWELIYEATAEGITVFVTTHYMDEAEYCNRVSIMSYDTIPAVVYTNPEIAGVGKTEEELMAANVRYSVLKLPMAYSGRFVAENELGSGLCKLIVNEQEQIIGCHIMGNPASELIVVAGIAIERKFTVDEFKQIVFPHPTVGEIIHESLFL